ILVAFNGAILYANNVGYIYSSQSSTPSVCLAKASHRVLLNLSTCPFACGLYGVDRWCLILNFSLNPSTNWFTKCVPLSECKCIGGPCLHMTSSYKNFTTVLASARLVALTSDHLVKQSTITTLYR